MKTTERGIILSRIPYSETSTIIRCFTLNHGLKSFLFQGAKKKNGHILMAMAPIEFTYYQRSDSQLGKMTEAQLYLSLQDLRFHPIKSVLLFFMAEMLLHTLHEDAKDEPLFQFVQDELMWLDESSEFTNYPIYWLLELTQHLGFYPYVVDEQGAYFDLEDGQFVQHSPYNHTSQKSETVNLLRELIGHSKNELLAWNISKSDRKKLTQLLFEYYQFHIPNFKELKSIEIIESIWS
ncbi:MAG: DNA repair protein RecO [Crocinitomicaceae bacterium]|nr:MAG: DNA repair protein RecO [Crocinitomicaceae bacterium]